MSIQLILWAQKYIKKYDSIKRDFKYEHDTQKYAWEK